jgi:hypothetical protein
MREVVELVAGLGRGGVEHVCLNKTGLEDVPGGLEQLLAALQRAGSAPADLASSDQWPLLELSEVRGWACVCACGGGPPPRSAVFDWFGGGGADATAISAAHGSDGGEGKRAGRTAQGDAGGDGSRQAASQDGGCTVAAHSLPPR